MGDYACFLSVTSERKYERNCVFMYVIHGGGERYKDEGDECHVFSFQSEQERLSQFSPRALAMLGRSARCTQGGECACFYRRWDWAGAQVGRLALQPVSLLPSYLELPPEKPVQERAAPGAVHTSRDRSRLCSR